MRALAAAVALLAMACVSGETYRRKEAEAARLERDWRDESARRSALELRVKELQAQVDALVAELNGTRDQVHAFEGTLATKEAELRAARAELARTKGLVDELSSSKERLELATAELEKKSADYASLAGALRSEIDAGRLELSELRGRTTVKMKDRVLFSSGSATLGKDGRASLRTVAAALRAVRGKLIRVEGHTDDVPTAGNGFASNWELSSARALAVVRALQESGVDPTRLAAAGYGEFQPIASNASPEGRSQNRRIEIVLAPLDGDPDPSLRPPPAPPSRRAKRSKRT